MIGMAIRKTNLVFYRIQVIPADGVIVSRQVAELVRVIPVEHVRLVPQTCEYSKNCNFECRLSK